MASTMLFATSDSEAAKKPRLRLIMRRSSSVSPSFDFHSAMSACIDTSVGIQWLLQPARYFSHAQRYFSGKSWFTSARALIMRLSSTDTRAPPRSISPRPVASATGAAAPSGGMGELAFGSDQSSILLFSLNFLERQRRPSSGPSGHLLPVNGEKGLAATLQLLSSP